MSQNFQLYILQQNIFQNLNYKEENSNSNTKRVHFLELMSAQKFKVLNGNGCRNK